jgi:hypothetical protein
VSISINAGLPPAEVLARLLASLLQLGGPSVTADQIKAAVYTALEELK